FHVAVQVLGDVNLTGFWPDVTGRDLDPVDAQVVTELGGYAALQHAPQEDVGRYVRASQMWAIGDYEEPTAGQLPERSLYTHFELTKDEEAAVARRELDLGELTSERRKLIAPIVDAIGEQVQAFLAKDLPDALLEMAAEKRTVLSNRQAVRDNLRFPDDWLAHEPKLEDSPQAHPVPVESELGQQAPQSDELRLNPRSRLDSATFDDVLFSLRHWANAVERYPAAFAVLAEDRISDLLAATWNATLPGAAREVYSRGGKSDIFIQADALDPGRGPAKVFICETKWATSHKVIRDALDPQLFGYLNVHDTSAILLVLMKQKNFPTACATYRRVLESIDGYQGTESGPVAGWPMLGFVRDSRKVAVCVAFVHLSEAGK
ncbi:MAG TPA: hypothetical protein VK662_05895, partial [Acidothermaceae bacterium]|nr:hypothetical protein [Acidothermaceae bacterium]